jgi:DNA-binding Lrp family transcriptional regulator
MQHNEIPASVRQFKGLWIPVEVLEMNLSLASKMLWADINSFTGRNSTFWKSNATIAEEYGVSARTITRCVNELISNGLIEEVSWNGRTRHLRSSLDKMSMQPRQNGEAASPNWLPSKQESLQPKKQSKYMRPSQDVITEYFYEINSSEAEALKFHDYYVANGWKQGGNKKILDWKAAARNWNRNATQYAKGNKGFKPENFDVNSAVSFVNNG